MPRNRNTCASQTVKTFMPIISYDPHKSPVESSILSPFVSNDKITESIVIYKFYKSVIMKSDSINKSFMVLM